MTTKPHLLLDRIRGMFMGAFLGDALGAPHEFRCCANIPYTGKLQHRAFMNSRWQGRKELEIGQVTDDSEMSLALLRTLVRDGGYNRDNVIMSYLEWANSGGWMMGINTREVLKGVTTIKGYQTRIAQKLALPVASRTQSNGAMMRSSPLALLWDNNSVIEDVNITNPNPVCQDCNIVYISALRLALQGVNGLKIFELVSPLAQTDEIKAVIGQVRNREDRNIAENKGWCLHALWCALMTITSFTNYSDAMRWIITSHPGSDTDTNACISGALLGANIGFERIQSEPQTAENIQILLNVNTANGLTPRPSQYSPYDFYELTQAAQALTL